jgi:hypothetical protein
MAKHMTVKMAVEAMDSRPEDEKPGPKRSSRKAQVTAADTHMALMACLD